jgi:hypothetical protein
MSLWKGAVEKAASRRTIQDGKVAEVAAWDPAQKAARDRLKAANADRTAGISEEVGKPSARNIR